jgi:hypothetical protein
MFIITDNTYQKARLIKLQKSEIGKEFASLAQWIDEKYQVKTLDISMDLESQNLEIMLDYQHDIEKFKLKNGYDFSERIKSAIIKKYLEQSNESFANLYVSFHAFEPLAKEVANHKVSLKTIENLKNQYENQLWEIRKFGEYVSFFFYTNASLNEAKANGLTTEIKQKNFDELKKQDEFNYFTFANFNAVFNSKQDFDTKHDGNWRSYYD